MSDVLNSAELEIGLHRQAIAENAWLTSKGLITKPTEFYDIQVIKEWYLPGSESYILDFEVNTDTIRSRLIAKACIKFFATETVDEWMNRRNILVSLDIAVPALYSIHRADYIEEYIPSTFKDIYKSAGPELKDHLEDEFKKTYQSLLDAGFSPVSLHDVRSRGEDVVVIDYGSDLGGISRNHTQSLHDSTRIESDLKRIIH